MKLVTPDIQVSADNQNWFSIFKAQEMMIFAVLMQNVDVHISPMFYLRVAPEKDVLDFTPVMSIGVGQQKGKK